MLCSFFCLMTGASVVDNPKISIKQIQSNERLQFNNTISYQQAYRVKEVVLQELWGDEQSVLLSLLTILIDLSQLIHKTEHTLILVVITGLMQHSSLRGLRYAGRHLRGFTAIDGTHTKSRYRMILLIACGIDANSNVVPLAWALVPIEDEIWWNWFLIYLKASYACESIVY
jgi:hypothetical protein